MPMEMLKLAIVLFPHAVVWRNRNVQTLHWRSCHWGYHSSLRVSLPTRESSSRVVQLLKLPTLDHLSKHSRQYSQCQCFPACWVHSRLGELWTQGHRQGWLFSVGGQEMSSCCVVFWWAGVWRRVRLMKPSNLVYTCRMLQLKYWIAKD